MEKMVAEERKTLREEQDKKTEMERHIQRLEAQLVAQNETQQTVDATNRVSVLDGVLMMSFVLNVTQKHINK